MVFGSFKGQAELLNLLLLQNNSFVQASLSWASVGGPGDGTVAVLTPPGLAQCWVFFQLAPED